MCMIKSLNKLHFEIIDGLSKEGRFCCEDLFRYLNYNPSNRRHFTKVDNALLDLCGLGCLEKHTTHIETQFAIIYNGKYKDLGLFMDMLKVYNDTKDKRENLSVLADRLEINKNLAGLLINSKI